MAQPTSNMKIYRASAGSGKTFTLVSEYIAMAIAHAGEPMAFAQTLAITFTNKATGEMKMRILSTLKQIADGDTHADAYVEQIKRILPRPISPDEIRRRCRATLKAILHNYDFFSVETIDSFFQGITADIATMIGYGARLQVFLSDGEAVSAAVDEMTKRAAEGGDQQLARMLNNYIDINQEEGTSWDFRRKLKRFGANVCGETYMQKADEINAAFGNIENFSKIRQALIREKKIAENEIEHLGDNLDIDFAQISNGKTLSDYVANCREGKDVKAGERVMSFINGRLKCTAPPAVAEAWRSQMADFERDKRRLYSKRDSAALTLANLSEMQMLQAIDSEVKRISREENRILLSKSKELIREQLRGESDVSFVFERAGRRFSHVMLDEAQDTSSMQFANMWKLIDNLQSSSGGRCVIVGDAKQSIYRWRSADSGILRRLAKEFDPEGRYTLRNNYRSRSNIVRFTGDVFTQLISPRGGTLADIYADVRQNAMAPEGGYVEVENIADARDTDEEGGNLRLKHLCANIMKARRAGVEFSDMAILTRRNSEITEISDYIKLLGLDIPISTAEANCILRSTAVRMVVAAMRYAHGEAFSPRDMVSGYFAAREYQRIRQGDAFSEPRAGEDYENVAEYVESALPQAFRDAASRITRLPIPEAAALAARTLGVMGIKADEPYLLTFFDYLSEYAERNPYDMQQFFDDWDVEAAGQFVNAASDGGVKAMTIHKAKGLEFHTVFIPRCDWKFVASGKQSQMWCTPHGGEPYLSIPVIPIAYNQKTIGTIYEDDYKRESAAIEIDNFNELYVAITRAKANLFIEYNYHPPQKEKPDAKITSMTAAKLIHEAIARLSPRDYQSSIVPSGK